MISVGSTGMRSYAAYLWQLNLGDFPVLILSTNVHLLDANVSAYCKQAFVRWMQQTLHMGLRINQAP